MGCDQLPTGVLTIFLGLTPKPMGRVKLPATFLTIHIGLLAKPMGRVKLPATFLTIHIGLALKPMGCDQLPATFSGRKRKPPPAGDSLSFRSSFFEDHFSFIDQA